MALETISQLLLATFLGALLGLEREYKKKEAGLQTYSLVVLGSCLFTLASAQFIDFNPAVIAIGIGFIGAGVIFHRENSTQGLTTAAGLWVAAAIGIAVGAKFYFLAIFTALLAILIFTGFGIVEEKIFKKQ